VDDLLLPVIQKMGKRGQAAAMNKQGNLNDFFDVTSGNGTYAPRKRQAYASKRLQQVVSDWRREQQKPTGESDAPDEESEEGPAKKKVKTKSPAGASRKKGRRARGGSTRKEKHASSSDYASDSSGISPKERTIQLRPRPKPAQGQ